MIKIILEIIISALIVLSPFWIFYYLQYVLGN